MDFTYLFVKSVDFIHSPWSPHVNPWILCIPWSPQGFPGGLRSTQVLESVEKLWNMLSEASSDSVNVASID